MRIDQGRTEESQVPPELGAATSCRRVGRKSKQPDTRTVRACNFLFPPEGLVVVIVFKYWSKKKLSFLEKS